MSTSEPVPVDACKGWTTSCSYCDKRFAEWKKFDDTEDDIIQKVPDKLVAYMFAFENKQGREVVSIGISITDSQQSIAKKLSSLRQQVSQRKSKDAKSSILFRWMSLPEPNSKEACALFAHWINYGVLPRSTTDWPGVKILNSTNHYQLSTLTGKWCHNTKEAIWRKTKSTHMPKAIKRCKWTEQCAFCDSRFTPWMSLSECREKKVAPDNSGFIMFAAKWQDRHKVYEFTTANSISYEISRSSYVDYVIKRDEKSHGSDLDVVVRWLAHDDLKDDDSCFIYAHWFNGEHRPPMNANQNHSEMDLAEKVLLNNSKFSFRTRDKQWCYAGETKVKPARYNKNKDKRYVQQSIEEDLLSE